MEKTKEIVYGDLEAILRYPREFTNGVSSYTNEEKRIIISYYLSNHCSIKFICEKFDICRKTFYNWLSIFASEKERQMKRRSGSINKLIPNPMPQKKGNPTESPEEELARLREENKKLQEALKMAEWSNHAKDVMIDLAEKTFNIAIRKKSGAKQ